MAAGRDWVDRAACRRRSDLDFFADEPSEEIIALCGTCPVRVPCLMEAISYQRLEDAGIWGGTTERQRHAMRRGKLEPWEVWAWQGYPYEDDTVD